ncbi:MAG: hypothetical protein HY829_10490 [Actinobacteria bacterium]|nr:hypothetical protein [Actinomycetota bacterium]
MAIPSVQVFLGEETAGIDGAVTWVDITTYLRFEYPVTRSYGRSYGGGAQPGTASLTLENTDGRFTVGNASSPYYPYVHLQALIKILRDGRPFFVGRIQAMPMSWPDGGDSLCVVTVSLADKMARYGRMTLRSYAIEEIASLGPTYYYPLNEPTGASFANSAAVIGAPLMVFTPGDGTVAFAGSTGPAGDGGSAPTFTPNTTAAFLSSSSLTFRNTWNDGSFGYVSETIAATFTTAADGILARLQLAPVGTVVTAFPPTILAGAAVGSQWIDLTVEVSGGVTGCMVRMYQPSGGMSGWWFFPAPSAKDKATHTVVVVVDQSVSHTTPVLYFDGAAVTSTSSLAPTEIGFWAGSVQITVGAASPSIYTPSPWNGSISHVAVWGRPLSAAEVLQVTNALLGSTITTQAAFLQVLGWRGQAGTALIDPGVTDNIVAQKLGGGTLAGVLGALNDSEMGTLYVDSQDRLTWKNRRTTLSPMATLTNNDINAPTYNCEIQGIQTRVTGTQFGTTDIVQAADINTIGEMTGSVTSISTVPDDALQHAYWQANAGPRGPFIGSLSIDLATAESAAFAAAITIDILAGITLTGMPSQTPPGSTVLEVIGVTETFSARSWDLTLTTLPAGLGSTRDLFILDDPTYGVLDSTHRLAY